MSQLRMLEASNKEIIEDAMIIDEDENSQEFLTSNNIGNDMPSTCVKHEGISAHKASLLKHSMSRTTCQKSFDIM